MKDLVIFDIRSSKFTEVNLEPQIKKEVVDNVYSKFKELGLRIRVTSIEDSEKFLKNFYEETGFKVSRCRRENINIEDFRTIYEYLRVNFKIHLKGYDWETFMRKKGAPDFLVYKIRHDLTTEPITEFFFVECKSNKGGLRMSQLLWMYLTDAPIKVVFVDKEGFYKDYKKEIDEKVVL